MERAGLEADGLCRFPVVRARRDTQSDFVRVRVQRAFGVQAIDADQVHAELAVPVARFSQALPDDAGREFRPGYRVNPRIGNLAFANEAIGISDGYFVGVRAGPRPGARDMHPVRSGLPHFQFGNVQHAVRRYIRRRIVQFIDQLLFTRRQVDPSAGVLHFADDEVPVWLHIDKGESQPGQIGHILAARAGKATAADLSTAFKQMPGRRACRHARPIIVGPAVMVHGGRQIKRRVRDAPGHHQLGARAQRADNDVRAQVGIGGHHARQQFFQRTSRFHQAKSRLIAQKVGDIVAQHRGRMQRPHAFPLCKFMHQLGGRDGIGGPHIRNYLHPVFQRGRQHLAHAVHQPGGVAQLGVLQPRLVLAGHGTLGQALECQVIEPAAFGEIDGRRNPVVGKTGPGADAQWA
ncbi:hypothetical protein D9M72_321620 [compost metagenome]